MLVLCIWLIVAVMHHHLLLLCATQRGGTAVAPLPSVPPPSRPMAEVVTWSHMTGLQHIPEVPLLVSCKWAHVHIFVLWWAFLLPSWPFCCCLAALASSSQAHCAITQQLHCIAAGTHGSCPSSPFLRARCLCGTLHCLCDMYEFCAHSFPGHNKAALQLLCAVLLHTYTQSTFHLLEQTCSTNDLCCQLSDSKNARHLLQRQTVLPTYTHWVLHWVLGTSSHVSFAAVPPGPS